MILFGDKYIVEESFMPIFKVKGQYYSILNYTRILRIK